MALTKALQKRIDLANKYIKFAQKHDIVGQGYFGSTWPSAFTYPHLITVSPTGRSVRVRYHDAYGKKEKHSESFNTNDEYQVSDLRHELSNYIIKAIKNGAKEEGISIPKTLSNPTKRKNSRGPYPKGRKPRGEGLNEYNAGVRHQERGDIRRARREYEDAFIAMHGADPYGSREVLRSVETMGHEDFRLLIEKELRRRAKVEGVKYTILKPRRSPFKSNPTKRKNARGDSMKFLPGGGLQIGEGKPFYPEKEHGPKEARRLLKTRKWSKFVEQWLTYYGKADWRAAKNVSKKFIFGRDSEGPKYEYYQALKVIDPFGWENARSPYKKSNPRKRKNGSNSAHGFRHPKGKHWTKSWGRIMRDYEKKEDRNDHSGNYLMIAEALGRPEHVLKELRSIKRLRDRRGLDGEQVQRQYQLTKGDYARAMKYMKAEKSRKRKNPDHKGEVNPYSKRYTYMDFTKKFWGKNWRDVPRDIRLSFWDDFKLAFVGGLQKYKEATRG